MSAPISHLHFGHSALLDLCLDRQCTARHDEVTRRQTLADRDSATRSRAELDSARHEVRAAHAVRVGYEDDGLTIEQLYRLVRDGGRRRSLAACGRDTRQHLRLEPFSLVSNDPANREGARGGIEPGADGIDPRRECDCRIGRHGEAQLRADTEERREILGGVDREPETCWIGEDDAGRASTTPFSGDRIATSPLAEAVAPIWSATL